MIRRNTIATPAATFGQRFGLQNLQPEGEARQDAEVWLNIGYETGDPEYPFVSLPFGIALDTMQPAQIRGRGNTDYAQFVAAKNSLLEQLQAAAATLAPGEEMILAPAGSEGGLVIQMRRKEAKSEQAPEVTERFAPRFTLAVPTAQAA